MGPGADRGSRATESPGRGEDGGRRVQTPTPLAAPVGPPHGAAIPTPPPLARSFILPAGVGTLRGGAWAAPRRSATGREGASDWAVRGRAGGEPRREGEPLGSVRPQAPPLARRLRDSAGAEPREAVMKTLRGEALLPCAC